MFGLVDYMGGIQPGIAQQSQQVPGDFSVAGNVGTLSGRIQEALGAKQPDPGGQVQDILSGRFQSPPPSFDDIGNSAIQTLQTGSYVPAQQYADKRMENAMTRLTALAKVQYLAKGGGSGSVFAQTMEAINSDPDLAQLSPMDKIRLAQNKVGTNLTMGANGQVSDMAGAAQGLGNLAYGEKKGGETGTQQVKQAYEPVTAGMTQNAKNEADITAAAPKAIQEKIGAGKGEAAANLNVQAATLPRLEQVVSELSALGKTATYTKAGQLVNSATRQMGAPVSQGAVDRTAYISKVSNEILPLLRQTFGAQFTEKEGQVLMATLGDPNVSPPEKDAVLKSFIDQKKAQVQTLQRQVGQTPAPAQNTSEQSLPTATNAMGHTVVFKDGKWQPM